MIKKKLLATLAVLTTLTILTACGSSDKKEASQPNNEEESTSMIVVKPDSELSDEMEEDLYNPEEICALYYDYIYGLIPEAEYLETLEAVFETNPDDAKSIFEEYGDELGYKIYEMSSEIQNSKVGDQIIQIGDVVVEFPCTVEELIELTGGELIDPANVKNTYRIFKELSLYSQYDTLEVLGQGGNILLKTSDNSILYCGLKGDGELHRAKELYINTIRTGSNNVFLAGGIHTGLSMEEIDAIFASLGEDMSYGSWQKQSDSVGKNPYLLNSVSTRPDRNWNQFTPIGAGAYSDEIVSVRIDAEGVAVYDVEALFATPYENN